MSATVVDSPHGIDLTSEIPFRVGTATIDPVSRDVTFEGGKERLQPQNLKVLILLARHAGQVVTREQLIDFCWDGRIVGDDVINRSISMLRQFADRVRGFQIETIPRAGYRLIEIATGTEAASQSSIPISQAANRAFLAVIIGALLFAIVVAVALLSVDGPALPGTKRTVAVLPFEALTDQQALADGIAEEVASRLSRNPRVRLLGRHSAQVLANDRANAIAVGRELRVDYLLTGRLVGPENHAKMQAQLVRTRDGEIVWNASFDADEARLITSLDSLSDLISRRLGAGALPSPGMKSPRPEAYQLYVSAIGMARGVEPEKVTAAVELLRQASRIDPDYAPIWSELGILTRANGLQHLKATDSQIWLRLSQAYARRGLELAPNSGHANIAMAFTLAEDPRSIPYLERALQLDSNKAGSWGTAADKAIKAGDFSRWIAAMNRMAELDPLDGGSVLWAAESNFEVGKESLAAAQLRRLARYGQPQPYMRHFAEGLLAMKTGQLAQAYEEFTQARDSPDALVWANWRRGQVAFALRMLDQARPLVTPINAYPDEFWQLVSERNPGSRALEVSRNAPVYAWNSVERNYRLLRILVNEGRFSDVAGLYDRRFRTPEDLANIPRGHLAFIANSIPVIIALRQVGRSAEAERIHQLALESIARRYRAGAVPRSYEVLAAQHYAIAGEQKRALDAIARAVEHGWLDRINVGTLNDGTGASMPDIAHEPAFRLLAENPRFRELRDRMQSIYSREGAKVLAKHNAE